MQVFAIAPAGTRGVVLILVVLVPVFVLVGMSLLGSWTARFEVSPEGLRLRGDLYGRLIPASQVVVDGVRRVDFATSAELAPRRRTLGTGLPGYQAGWFRLANGDSALVYLTDRSRAVFVPTTAGYSVLLSPSDPDGFVGAVRSLGR
jgi:hypothetical protein